MFGLQERLETLIAQPRHQLGRGARFLRTQVDLWRFCARRLHENNIGAMSAALSFRTIFALIPTLVVIFLGLKSMGVIEDGKRALRDVLDTSGFAQLVAVERQDAEAVDDDDTRMVTAADQIEQLVDDVEQQLTFERIGPIGALVLIWTAMTLLTTLEGSLNRIFGAPRARPLTERVIMFWTTLTLGPILIMAAIFAGQAVIAAAAGLPILGWLATPIGWLMPTVMGVLVVAAGYKLIPNTHVRYRAAIGGALVAVPAWMIARWAFAIYVERFVIEGNLYGVLGLLPLFLLWLNVSWSIFLFGGELAHTAASLSHLRRIEHAERMMLGPSDWLIVMLAVGERYQRGAGSTTRDELSNLTGLPGETLQRMLERLAEQELLTSTGDRQPGWMLQRPPEQIALGDLQGLGDPRHEGEGEGPLWERVRQALEPGRAAIAARTLADLCPAEPTPRTLSLPSGGGFSPPAP